MAPRANVLELFFIRLVVGQVVKGEDQGRWRDLHCMNSCFAVGRERRQTTNLTAVGNGHEPVLSVLSRDVVKKHRIPTRSFALSFASCAIACTFGDSKSALGLLGKCSMGTSSARRRGSSIAVPNRQVTVGSVVRWSVAGFLVTCAILVLVLPWPLPYEQSIEQIMQDRAQHLLEQCETIRALGNLTAPNPRTSRPNYLYFNYFYQPQHQLLWCSISKVASSSWMYQFNRWAGVPREKIDSVAHDMKGLTRMYYPVPTRADVERMKQNVEPPVVTRFLLVRDPFDRFVSAYEDLIVRPQSDNYRNLRRFIFREVYGADTPLGSNNEKNGTSGDDYPVPSFSDFTEFVLRRPNVLDPHWNTYYNLCDPCFLEPTVIVKLETYDRDVAHILRLANVSSDADNYDNAAAQFEGYRLNVNHHRGSPGDNGRAQRNSTSTVDRLAELTEAQFERLYRRYELDFRLFQYDASHYFALYRTD